MVALLSTVVAAGVWLAAAATKLIDSPDLDDVVQRIGIRSTVLRRAAGRAVPVAEAGLGILILLPPTHGLASAAALLATIVLTVLATRILRQGAAVACRCFGSLSAEEISIRTVARNASFSAVMAFALIAGPTGDVVVAAGAVVIAVQAVVVLDLLVQRSKSWASTESLEHQESWSDQLPPVEPPPPPGPAPEFEGTSVSGARVTLPSVLAPGKPAFVLFVDPACAGCHQVLERLRPDVDRLRSLVELVVVSAGSQALNEGMAVEFGVDLLVQRDFEIGDVFGVQITPELVIVSPEGMATAHVLGARRCTEFFDAVLASARPATSSPVGR